MNCDKANISFAEITTKHQLVALFNNWPADLFSAPPGTAPTTNATVLPTTNATIPPATDATVLPTTDAPPSQLDPTPKPTTPAPKEVLDAWKFAVSNLKDGLKDLVTGMCYYQSPCGLVHASHIARAQYAFHEHRPIRVSRIPPDTCAKCTSVFTMCSARYVCFAHYSSSACVVWSYTHSTYSELLIFLCILCASQ